MREREREEERERERGKEGKKEAVRRKEKERGEKFNCVQKANPKINLFTNVTKQLLQKS